MPSKKRKYNARFPAGRIKKIMQTDEEVGKVAQAVPIIIYLELFVESLLRKAMQVTQSRNAKTLSPSHVKQCILAEARFDFLRDLVKNIPDVSAAEEKEMMSAESSPNSSRFSEMPVQRRVLREDSNSSSSCDMRLCSQPQPQPPPPPAPAQLTKPRVETVTSIGIAGDGAIDLTKKKDDDAPRMAPNFYQETLVEAAEQAGVASVIQVNPTYANQPSTSTYIPLERVQRIETPTLKKIIIDVKQNNNVPTAPKTPVTPILNIDFTKNLCNPEIKVIDTTAANIVGVKDKISTKVKQNLKAKIEVKKDFKLPCPGPPVDIDHINSGNLQIDEDYDT